MKKSLLLLSIMTLGATNAFATIYSGAGSAFNDATVSFTTPGVTTYNINVTSDVSSVNSLTLNGLSHTWVGDLTIELSNGLGNAVVLHRLGATSATSFGDSSDFGGGNYSFAVGGADPLAEASLGTGAYIMTPGTYALSQSDMVAPASITLTDFSSLVGAGSAGAWTITVTDWGQGDTGGFQTYDLDVTDAVPEPATMAVLGVAALAAARRRKNK